VDRACIIDRGWMNDHWWQAVTSGVGIANHSWDHNHECMARVAQRPGRQFLLHRHEAMPRADPRARSFIAARQSVALFGYPYGHVNAFLSKDYLPRRAQTRASSSAFGTEAGFMSPAAPLEPAAIRLRLALEIQRGTGGSAARPGYEFRDFLEQFGIVVRIRRLAGTEDFQQSHTGIGDVVRGIRRDDDGIAGLDGELGGTQSHQAGTLGDMVNFLG
jgi:hypothetical protein